MTPAEAQAAAWQILGSGGAASQARTFAATCGGDAAVLRAVAAGLREIASEVVALVPGEPASPAVDFCGARVTEWRAMPMAARSAAHRHMPDVAYGPGCIACSSERCRVAGGYPCEPLESP